MREFLINDNDAGQRLDKFVQKAVRGIPASLMYRLIRQKKIKVNRKRAEPGQMLCRGDVVLMFVSEELFGETKETSVLENVRPQLTIVYEDENILLCDKKPGVLVHSGDGDDSTDAGRGTLLEHILAYLYQKGEYNPSAENSFAPALCNRIDRNTGGIVIAAKNAEALREMNAMIRDGRVNKFYLAALKGRFDQREGTLTGYLTRDFDKKTVTVTDRPVKGARTIVTAYSIAAYNREKDISLAKIQLITGRTHQIRAHFASIGHPLLGDGKYGVNEADRKKGWSHQALYSYMVKFDFGNEGYLGYLTDRVFTVKRENIRFLGEFPGQEEKIRPLFQNKG